MTVSRLSVLVLGGYGAFGGRLVRLLADAPGLKLGIAGRSRQRAQAFCAALSQPARPQAELVAMAFDRDGAVEHELAAIAPDIVVDASGPFQAYGARPYRVAEACIALGIDYIDLADGAAFVDGFARLDAAARARGVFALAGASSYPVLTCAAVRRLSAGMAEIESVKGGIAPSPYAGIGRNVIRAIASYAGQPIALLRNGRPAVAHALIDSCRFTIAPPGRLPLRSIRFGLIDVPDLQLVPNLWPQVKTVWLGAGSTPESLQYVLVLFATLVRLKLVPSLAPVASLMHRAINLVRWGEHRGGMFIAVSGRRPDGTRIERSWHMIAEGDDGPFIPSMAAEAIIRRCLAGQRPPSGARAAVADVELADYEARFATKTIVSGVREVAAETNAPLYRRVLGEAWELLPAEIRAMHDNRADVAAQGTASVERGTGLLARLLAGLFRFPPSQHDIPVKVTFLVRDGREIWRRDFGEHSFTSTHQQGTGRQDWLLVERFGAVAFGLALVVADARLHFVVRSWSLFGVPLPAWLAPGCIAFESVEDGRFRFDVEIGAPLVGRIVRYRGWLQRAANAT